MRELGFHISGYNDIILDVFRLKWIRIEVRERKWVIVVVV